MAAKKLPCDGVDFAAAEPRHHRGKVAAHRERFAAALNRRTVEAVGSGTLHYHQTGRIFRKAVDKNALYRRGERTDPRLNKDVGRPVDPGGTQL